MSSEDIQTPGRIGLGCGPFYLCGQGLSLIHAEVARKRSIRNAHLDAEFESEMRGRKEYYADKKAEREIAFNRAKYEQKRLYKQVEAKKRLINDLDADELKMFLGDWPLVLDVYTILNDPVTYLSKMHFILARKVSARVGDPVVNSYMGVAENVKENLKGVGVTDDQVLVYSTDARRVGWPAVANIFAMMQSFPVIMIIPDVLPGEKDKLSFSVSLWTKDSSFPMNRRLFSIDYKEMRMKNDAEYYRRILSEIVMAETVIAGVLHDCYQITLSPESESARFPAVAKQLGVEQYPVLLDFMLQEYRSLGSPENTLSASTEYDLNQLDVTLRARLDLIAQRAREAAEQTLPMKPSAK